MCVPLIHCQAGCINTNYQLTLSLGNAWILKNKHCPMLHIDSACSVCVHNYPLILVNWLMVESCATHKMRGKENTLGKPMPLQGQDPSRVCARSRLNDLAMTLFVALKWWILLLLKGRILAAEVDHGSGCRTQHEEQRGKVNAVRRQLLLKSQVLRSREHEQRAE